MEFHKVSSELRNGGPALMMKDDEEGGGGERGGVRQPSARRLPEMEDDDVEYNPAVSRISCMKQLIESADASRAGEWSGGGDDPDLYDSYWLKLKVLPDDAGVPCSSFQDALRELDGAVAEEAAKLSYNVIDCKWVESSVMLKVGSMVIEASETYNSILAAEDDETRVLLIPVTGVGREGEFERRRILGDVQQQTIARSMTSRFTSKCPSACERHSGCLTIHSTTNHLAHSLLRA